MARAYRIEPFDGEADYAGPPFSQWNAHPMQGAFAWALYQTVLGGTHRRAPFMVVGPDGPLVLVRCTIGGGTVGFYGMPLLLACRDDATPADRRGALAAAFDHLAGLAAAAGGADIVVAGESAPNPGLIDRLCLDRSGHGALRGHAMIDLAADVDQLRRDIRDSYRSLINWGGRTMAMTYVNQANPDRAAFDLFPAFHAKIAGGRRRGDDYWDVYWQEIVGGRGELSLGHIEPGGLVSGTLVVSAGETCYYASGVYDRGQFDKPLGHFPLWQAILRAKERGCRWFDLGEIYARGHASDKEVNIDFFKRGFSSGRILRPVWSISVGGAEK